MRAPFASLPALPLAAGIIAGILCHTADWPVAVPICAAAAGLLLMALRRHYTAFAFYAVAVGWLAAFISQPVQVPATLSTQRHTTLLARVLARSMSPHGQTLIVSVDSACGSPAFTPFRAAVTIPDAALRHPVGEQLRISTTLQPAISVVDFPHQRDFTPYYRRHRLAAKAYAAPDSVHHIGRVMSVAAHADDRRDHIETLLVRAGIDDRAFGLLSAILLGDRDNLDPVVSDNYRAAGAAHALALSGFHVGIIVMLTSIALFPLRLWQRARVPRMLLSAVAVWAYAILTGMGPSVVRASVMLTAYVLARAIGRDTSPLNSLCLAVAVILAADPYALFSAGLQMSVAAILGILAFSDLLNRVPPHRTVLRAIAALAVIPVSATLGTGLLTICYFGRLPLLFVISNILISLLMPLLMTGGILAVLCAACAIPCAALSAGINSLAALADRTTAALATLPGTSTPPVFLTPAGAAAIAILIVALWIYLRGGSPRWRIAAAACAPAALLTAICSAETIPPHEIYASGDRGHTAIVMRSADTIATVLAADTPRVHMRHIHEHWRHFAESRRAASINPTAHDFDLGPYRRRGDLITIGGATLHLARRRITDSIPAVTYSLVTTLYRSSPATYLRHVRTDTVVLSRGLSATRTDAWLDACRQAGIPVIDMHTRPWHPTLTPAQQ